MEQECCQTQRLANSYNLIVLGSLRGEYIRMQCIWRKEICSVAANQVQQIGPARREVSMPKSGFGSAEVCA
jgi:hypothetical protein